MSASTYGVDALIKAARAAAEAFIATLDEASGHVPAPAAVTPSEPAELIEYDPLCHEPPFAPDPNGTEPQKRLAYVTYLGAIGRLNAEEGRGATSKEIPEFARKAGYSDGKAVNGWNSRPSSPRAVENIDGERFLNVEGRKWIETDAKKLGLKLVGEIGGVPVAG